MNTYKSADLLIRYARIVFLFLIFMSLCSCNLNNLRDLNASGPITRAIDDLFWITVALMSLVIVPVIGMTGWFIWKFRASNSKAVYAPNWDASYELKWMVWLFPVLIILILGIMSWIYTHRLDPYKPQAFAVPPLEVQVIALNWKWLFIYPEQNIAVVNELAIPVNRPVALKITSNTVMNAFFIPRLGGQIYAMAGMETQLHLIADKPGHYFGENIQYSGEGFPYQNFETLVTTQQDFDTWIKKAGQSPRKLDLAQFNELAKASIKHPVVYYASVSPDLFKHVIDRLAYGQGSLSTSHITHNNSGASQNVR